MAESSYSLRAIESVFPKFVKNDIPVFLLGPTGIGKTEFIYNMAQELGFDAVCDWRANQRDTIEARGIIVPDHDKKETRFYRTNDLPFEGSDWPEKTLVFLDEATQQGAIQTVVMQIMHERRVGEHKFKNGVYVVGAGNMANENAASGRLLSTVRARCALFNVAPCAQSWLLHAAKKNFHAYVQALIRIKPELLHQGETLARANVQFSTPRGLERVSEMLHDENNAKTRRMEIASLIGDDAANAIESIAPLIDRFPDLESIFSNPESVEIPAAHEFALAHAVAGAIAYNMTRDNAANALRYLKRMPKDYESFAMLAAESRDKALATSATFTQWKIENQSAFI